MKPIPRRKFIQDAILAGGGLMILPVIKGCKSPDSQISGNYFLNEFGIDEAICRKLLAKALSKGGTFADLYFEYSVSNYLGLEDGKVNRSYGDISLGVGIRTVKGDQVGYGFTQDLSEESMMSAAATAATISDSGAGEVAPFNVLKTGNYYPVDPEFIGIPGQLKLPVLQKMNQKCFALSPEIVKVNAGFSSKAKRTLIITSDGVIGEDFIPSGFLYASVVAERNGRREQAGWNLGGCRDFTYYTEDIMDKIANKAVGNAIKLFDAIQPPAGEVPVVLVPVLQEFFFMKQ
jgi:TldD protein